MLLRDFQPGDSLHRIYWKMAAKGDGLQVRDFERGSLVSLFLHCSEELRAQADAWDRYLDRAASFLYFCAEECGLGISGTGFQLYSAATGGGGDSAGGRGDPFPGTGLASGGGLRAVLWGAMCIWNGVGSIQRRGRFPCQDA